MTGLHVVHVPDNHLESHGQDKVDAAGSPSFQQGDLHVIGPFDSFENSNRAEVEEA
jgi:hypothetical protein